MNNKRKMKKKKKRIQAWWYKAVIPAFWRKRQEDLEPYGQYLRKPKLKKKERKKRQFQRRKRVVEVARGQWRSGRMTTKRQQRAGGVA
jgi:hypothetical protein